MCLGGEGMGVGQGVIFFILIMGHEPRRAACE